MHHKVDSKRLSLAIILLIIVITGVIWWLLSFYRIVNPYLLPSPATVCHTAADLIRSGELPRHLWISTQRILAGYLIATGISAMLVLLIQTRRIFRLFLMPLINYIRQIPPLALIPLLLIWIGIGEAQKITIIVLGCIFPIFFGFLQGAQQADPKLLEVASLLKLSGWQKIQKIYFPSSLPSITTGLQVGAGFAWRSLVGAELIASSSGLGYMILDAEDLSRSDIVIVGIITIGILGIISDNILKKFIYIISPWLKYNKNINNTFITS